jgi:hypothetical protein
MVITGFGHQISLGGDMLSPPELFTIRQLSHENDSLQVLLEARDDSMPVGICQS